MEGSGSKNLSRTQLSSGGTVDPFIRAVARAPSGRPPLDLLPGSAWGSSRRYILQGKLGRGGMGTVYVARDTLLGRQVALKVLDFAGPSSEPRRHERLLTEARLAARIEHERVARVYDVGEFEDAAFVAMELIKGSTLRVLMTTKVIGAEQALGVARQIAQGLAVLHRSGIIHRDLKPENVMLCEEGGAKLVDFGLAREAVTFDGAADPLAAPPGAGATNSAISAGTPGYMAPEQIMGGRLDARVDVFAFGVLLHELLTGHRPFRGGDAPEIAAATLRGLPLSDDSRWTAIPPSLRDIITRALALAADDRFVDGTALLTALEKVGLPSAPAGRNPGGRRWIIPAGTLMALALVGLGTFLWPWSSRPAGPAPPGMVWVPGGRLTVGRTAEEVERDCLRQGSRCDRRLMLREVPAAEVVIRPFLLDKHEVTNQEMVDTLNTLSAELYLVKDEDTQVPRYVRFNKGIGKGEETLLDVSPKEGGIEYSLERQGFRAREGRQRHPVIAVSWYGARLFCATRGKRLPSENEWEAAARGAGNRPYPWGDTPARPGAVALPLDTQGSAPPPPPVTLAIVPVGSAHQDVTPEGIHDLGGNVSEWTESSYVEGDRTAPTVPVPSLLPRTIRGGSWASSFMARSTARNRRLPSSVALNVGFRCASGG
jgi:formylglycine-generating enzyme required for sulfatase activity/predicted Ser/Thr protein kinase